jgi:hypothetical protein
MPFPVSVRHANAVLHIGLFRRDANGVFVPVAIGHARLRSWGRWSSRRRAGARRLSITKEWCYGPRNAPPASGHCPYSRPAPKPNRRGRPPVSARIARRLDDLLERVALLPVGEPPRPQVRPADKPRSPRKRGPYSMPIHTR